MSKATLTKIRRLISKLDQTVELDLVDAHTKARRRALHEKRVEEAWRALTAGWTATTSKPVMVTNTGTKYQQGEVLRCVRAITRGKDPRVYVTRNGPAYYLRPLEDAPIQRKDVYRYGFLVLPDNPLRREAAIARWKAEKEAA